MRKGRSVQERKRGKFKGLQAEKHAEPRQPQSAQDSEAVPNSVARHEAGEMSRLGLGRMAII